MKNRVYFFYWIIIDLTFTSCETLKQSSKYQFNDGFYQTKLNGKTSKVYVLGGFDTIKAYRKADLGAAKIDSTIAILIKFPAKKPYEFITLSFSAKTLDVDVLTVLIKYRPPVKDFSPQFNATFNGAAYFAFRTDVYRLSYKETPMHVYKREINHYGYSVGIFSGLGTARIDEYVTNNA